MPAIAVPNPAIPIEEPTTPPKTPPVAAPTFSFVTTFSELLITSEFFNSCIFLSAA